MCSSIVILASIAFLPAANALTVVSRSDKLVRFLQAEGHRLDCTEMLQLSEQARQPDQLDKVKQLISHMIAKHQAAQAEDTDHKGFCDKEMVASKAKIEKMKMDLQKRTADGDLHSAKLAELKDSIGDLHEEIANAHKDRKKAADLRSKEAAAYKKFQADSDETLVKLRRQRSTTEIRKEKEELEKAEEELTLKKVKAENKEEDSQFKYKKMDRDLEVAIAKKTREVELKERTVVSKTHDQSLADGDFKIAKDEMAAAKDYAEKIRNTCVVRVDPAKERRIQRKEQISSLKEAYGILSGTDIPR